MTFATADASGLPHARTVLITEVDATSVRFHSSRPTTKTSDIAAQPRASGVFYWPGRQVVLRGVASELSAASSRAAFPSRPLGLRRLAWAYEALGADGSDSAVAPGDVERAFAAAGAAQEMPPSWTTIRLVPGPGRISGRRATTTAGDRRERDDAVSPPPTAGILDGESIRTAVHLAASPRLP